MPDGRSDSSVTERFRVLHRTGEPLVMPNAWDLGSARILASLGFRALGTTSSGYAASLGRVDHALTAQETLAHAGALAAGVDVPISADLEAGYGETPDQVGRTIEGARATALAGCSIEDATGDAHRPVHPLDVAVERVRAAADARGALVLTARAENHLYGRDDLRDTIARLQAYAEAGADVLYAPGLRAADDIRAVVDAVAPAPVNVLTVPGAPSVAELADLGVARISVGGALAFAAYAALGDAARELLEDGTYGFLGRSRDGIAAVARAAGQRGQRRSATGLAAVQPPPS